MRSLLTVVLLLGCVACSGATNEADDLDDSGILLITRPEGREDSTWDTGRGHLRVEADCILVKGQLAVFPSGTRLVEGSSALQVGDEEPITLDGSAEVDVMGSEVPLGTRADWGHAMDAANLDRWSECLRRAEISEYADWWQVIDIEVVSTR